MSNPTSFSMTAPTSPPAEDSTTLRAQVIATGRAMIAAGLGVNAEGNVSARCVRGAADGFVITPTGLRYDALVPADLVFVRLADGAAQGARAPSSEWRFHRDIYAARPGFGAIVHTHGSVIPVAISSSRVAPSALCPGRWS